MVSGNSGRARGGRSAAASAGDSTRNRAVEPEQPIAGVRPLQELVDVDIVARRQQAILLSLFAGLALLLAGLGLYGVLAHVVTQRRREIAVRMALGASGPSVMGLVAIRSQLLVATGLGIGLALAFAATRILQTLLDGVTAPIPSPSSLESRSSERSR